MAWSKIIEEHGVRVRLYERNGTIYRAVAVERVTTENGHTRTRQDRKSLGHGNRKRAEEQAEQLCKALAKQRLAGVTPDTLTLSDLHTVYLRENKKLLSDSRQNEVDKAFDLLKRHLRPDFKVADLGPHQVRTYTAARQDGTLKARGGRNVKKGVRAGTVAKELGVLHAALNWAETFKQNSQRLIARNPIRGVPLPSESNPARPVASAERFEKMLEVADDVESEGVFKMMLVVAWTTGRRLGSIVALRASDVLLTSDHVERALADAGREEYLAAEWPAAIRWAAEADKEGVEWIVPIPDVLVNALTDYIRKRGVVGNALLFPARRDPDKPISKETCYYWFRQAEKKAKLPHQRRGGWHALRRAWATARKHLPLQDVMAAGGWRDPSSLQKAYQHADAETVRKVMELGT